MELRNVMESAPVIDSRETISKAVSLMLRESREAIVVLKGKDFFGILTPRDLAVRSISNADKTLVEKYVECVKPLSADAGLSEIINFVLINNYNAVPVLDNGKYFYVTKLNLLAAVKDTKVLKEVKAADIMMFRSTVKASDAISSAVSIMRNEGISSVPVVNDLGAAEGLVEMSDLLKLDMVKNEKHTAGLRGMENIGPKESPVANIMKKKVPTASPETTVNKLAELMLRARLPGVVIEKDGGVVGFVAPKMILKLAGKAVSGVYVNISGLQKEDDFVKETIDGEISSELTKLAKIFPVQSMAIHVERLKDKQEGRVKYALRGRILTAIQGGAFFAQESDWDATKAVKGLLAKFEKEMLSKKGKMQSHGRAP